MNKKSQHTVNQIIETLKSQKGLSSAEQIKLFENLYFKTNQEQSIVLIELLKIETNPGFLIYLCNTASKLNDDDTVMALVDLLLGNREIENGDDPLKQNKEEFLKIRCTAIKALGRMKNEKALIPLMYILNNKDENYKIRLDAAEALGRIGDSHAVTPLINLVTDEKEKSVYVRESAAKALGMLGDVRALKPLVKVLESKRGIVDKFTFLKEQIIESIGKLSGSIDKDTLRALKESLMDEAPSVRLSAVEALGDMEDRSLIKVLVPIIFDEDEDVAREAVRSIYNLDGRLELESLLDDDNIPGWSRDEIETLFNEDSL